jgi:hypothetical protein
LPSLYREIRMSGLSQHWGEGLQGPGKTVLTWTTERAARTQVRDSQVLVETPL